MHPKPDQPDFDPVKYRQTISGYAKGRWLQLPKDFLYFLNRDETIALTYIIDAADRFKSLERRRGWFYLTRDKLQAQTRMDKNVQDRVIKSLITKGLLLKRRKGVPPRREFFILTDHLNDCVAEAYRQRKAEFRKLKRKQHHLRHKEEFDES